MMLIHLKKKKVNIDCKFKFYSEEYKNFILLDVVSTDTMVEFKIRRNQDRNQNNDYFDSFLDITLSTDEKLRYGDSFCAGASSDYGAVLNYKQSESDSVIVYDSTNHQEKFNISTLEEEYFQLSTVKQLKDIEFYQYLKNTYYYYENFIPPYSYLTVFYRNAVEEEFKSEPFLELITTKLWGILALA